MVAESVHLGKDVLLNDYDDNPKDDITENFTEGGGGSVPRTIENSSKGTSTSYGINGKGSSAFASGKSTSASGKYQVGAYEDIKGVTGMDAHHVGQKALMKNLVTNYDGKTAPAINVPKVGHTISGPSGTVSRSAQGIETARQLLARDLFELKRVYPDVPNSAFKELINMNKNMYPEMRK